MGRRSIAFAVRGLLAGVVLMSGVPLGVASTSAASGGSGVRAILNGGSLALADVSRYQCHDRAYPIIRCFVDRESRDLDELTLGPLPDGVAASAGVSPFVRWYVDKNFGGSSFDAYTSYTNLGSIGWNDKISSFSTYAGGHPRWSQDIGFGGTRWDWGTASVTYVGDPANDKFSSVERL